MTRRHEGRGLIGGTVALVLALVAILIIAAASAWLARTHLAEAWLAHTLADAGYPEARFDVTAVGPRQLVLEELALNGARETRVRRLQLDYGLGFVVLGWLDRLRVTAEGLRSRLEPRGTGGGAGASAAGGQGLRDAVAAATRLGRIRVADARVAVTGDAGTWQWRGRGELGQDGGDLVGRLTGRARNPTLRLSADIDAHLRSGRFDGTIDAREDDGARARMHATAERPWSDAAVHLEGSAILPGQGDLPWLWLGLEQPSAGRVRVAVDADGRMALAGAPPRWPALLRRAAAGDWSGRWRVDGRGLTVPYRFAGLDVRAAGDLAHRDGALVVAADTSPRLRLAGVDESLRQGLGIPAFAAAHADGPVEVDWRGETLMRLAPAEGSGFRVMSRPRLHVRWPGLAGAARAHGDIAVSVAGDGSIDEASVGALRLEASGWRAPGTRLESVVLQGRLGGLPGAPRGTLRLTADAERLTLERGWLAGVEVRAPLRVTGGDGGPRIVTDGAARAMVRRWALGERMTATTELRARLEHARLGLSPPFAWAAAMTVEPFQARLDLAGAGERARIVPGTMRAGGEGLDGRLVVLDGRARLPGRDLRARGIDVDIGRELGTPTARFRVDRLVHHARPAWFAPIGLDGRVEAASGGYALSAEGRWLDSGTPLRISGNYAPAADAAAATVVLPPVEFSPDGLQPGDLMPALPRLEAARGTAKGRLRWRLRPGEAEGDARLTLADFGFTHAGVAVRGVEGETRWAGLSPLRTDGRQRLRVGRIASAVALTDARLTWRGREGAGDGLRVRVAEARADVLGGRAVMTDTAFDTAAPVHNFDVRVDGVRLQPLFERMGIEGLSGQGRLDGRVPLTVGEPGVAVRGARLRGRDGRVALRSAGADAALADAGREARLMLAALRDFRYDRLEVGVDAPLSGSGAVEIRLNGRNPDVLDGEPFFFDVALAGEITPLLSAMARGEPLSGERIERHLNLRAVR